MSPDFTNQRGRVATTGVRHEVVQDDDVLCAMMRRGTDT